MSSHHDSSTEAKETWKQKQRKCSLYSFNRRNDDDRGPGDSLVEHWVVMQKAECSNPTPPGVAPPNHQGPPWCQSQARIKMRGLRHEGRMV
ncbi:hypothetical protein EXN66_Car008806 [Channa argus]|uniref:Uncharacterized protein n=1 Tax=Channa argus TaxID=215402 RepID=A0A6G1PS47_CHAAH|nr:hypothetical protein EXN66_Car008806 [Channa argus]